MTKRLTAVLSLSAFVCLLAFLVGKHVHAQTGGAQARAIHHAEVTAAASGARVRFAAPGLVVQLRLEVYDEAGRKLFDTEQRGGSVLDWHWQGGAGERLAAGQYLCVVTVKDLRGRLSQRVGLATVDAQGATVRPAEASAMSAAQAAAVGPVEEGAALAVVSHEGEAAAPAATVAHDGADAQLNRTRGALSFRVGNFLTGTDREQMRLTEDGRLGVGMKEPQAALDVAGSVRASEGFRFSDGTTLNSSGGKLTLRDAAGDPVSLLSADGTGTQNRVAKWAETGGQGTLTDSALYESGGLVGVGTTAPEGTLHIQSPDTTVFKVVSTGTAATGRAVFQMYRGAAAQANGWDFGYNTDLSSENFIIRELTNGAPQTRFAIRKGTGRIGIGTATPAELLDVNGNARFTPGGSGGAIQFGTPNAETGMTISGGSGGRAELRFDGLGLKLVAGAPGFTPPPTNGIAISTAGRVGIGFDPTFDPVNDPPIGKLHVRVESRVPAVFGESQNRGVWGVSRGASFGVFGESVIGIGVQGVSTSNIGTVGGSTSNIGVFGSTAAGDVTTPGVQGTATGAGGVGVRGDGTTGVYGLSQAAGGIGVTGQGATGVYGVSASGVGVTGESASGYAIYANGNAGQARDRGGFVKAMIFVNPFLPADQYVVRCYNGLTNASTPATCGFSVTRSGLGAYTINFGFQVNDRFFSLAPVSEYITAAVAPLPSATAVRVRMNDNFSDPPVPADSQFWIIVF